MMRCGDVLRLRGSAFLSRQCFFLVVVVGYLQSCFWILFVLFCSHLDTLHIIGAKPDKAATPLLSCSFPFIMYP